MTGGGAQDSFELRVEFAGLCMYMVNGDADSAAEADASNRGTTTKVAVVMPDARKAAGPVHPDGSKGEPHVGYVRFNLANLDLGGGVIGAQPGTVEDDSGRPANEIIHRFDQEDLFFRFNDDLPDMTYDIGIPSFNRFADSLTHRPGVLDPSVQPPNELLMRTLLNGGNISASGSGKTWTFSSVLRGSPNGDPYANQFAGYAMWRRPLTRETLTVEIRKFSGGEPMTIQLKCVPVQDVHGQVVRNSTGGIANMITIKVANLCSNNPMEWREYPTRTVGDRDIDFKWLYRLLEPKSAAGNPGNLQEKYKKFLRGAELPFPREISVQAFGDEDCIGGSFTTPF